jgi:hypothetical protein
MRRSALKPQFPAKVRAARCATCIFGPNTPLSRERFAELAATWGKMRGSHQICHQHGTGDDEGGSDGEDVWCAGFWETQLTEHWRALFVALRFVVFVPAEPLEQVRASAIALEEAEYDAHECNDEHEVDEVAAHVQAESG